MQKGLSSITMLAYEIEYVPWENNWKPSDYAHILFVNVALI